MVIVKVFFEGGAHPASNPNAATITNTALLREAFNKLLNSGLSNESVRIQAFPAYSISNVVKKREENSLLLIDMDGEKTLRDKRLEDQKMKDIKDSVFFMVQRMEAWILSQPHVVEEFFKEYRNSKAFDAQYEKLIKMHPETIKSPDNHLSIILKKYYTHQKAGKSKKLEYGKLKHAPLLIERLNVVQLKETFEDVKNIFEVINSLK